MLWTRYIYQNTKNSEPSQNDHQDYHDEKEEDDDEEKLKMKVAHMASLLGQGGYRASTMELMILVLIMTMMMLKRKRRMQMNILWLHIGPYTQSLLEAPPKTKDSLIAWPQKI